MAATAEELLTWVYNLFAAINEQRAFDRYSEHVQKLNVAAGDHCLYSDPVEPGKRRHVTSICSMAECADVSVVTLARGFMHNVFEAGRTLTPGEDETTCAEGLWILGPGEYMQACFEDVPEGCNLNLFLNGSGFRPPMLSFPLPNLVSTEELEAEAGSGFYVLMSEAGASRQDVKLYDVDAEGAGTLIGTLYTTWAIYHTGLAFDGTYLYTFHARDNVPTTINKIKTWEIDGSFVSECSITAPPLGRGAMTYDETAAEPQLLFPEQGEDPAIIDLRTCAADIVLNTIGACTYETRPICWKSGTNYIQYYEGGGKIYTFSSDNSCGSTVDVADPQTMNLIHHRDGFIYGVKTGTIYKYNVSNGALIETITLSGMAGEPVGIVKKA